MVDTSGLSMTQLLAALVPGTPAHDALLRVVASLDDPDGIISAFQSFVK